jgi:hypothetical protein
MFDYREAIGYELDHPNMLAYTQYCLHGWHINGNTKDQIVVWNRMKMNLL